MTKEEFRFIIDTKKEFEFSYKGTNYNITYGKDDKNCNYIQFGQTYMGEKYYSFADFMNTAKVQNHYLREMLDIL